jgi:uracil-DNA glycosylase
MSLVEYIPREWAQLLREELATPWFAALEAFVADERARGDVYPPEDEVFAALRLTPFAKVRAVILGQDPYHGPGEAHGLAFSIAEGRRRPSSLRNILAEWAADTKRPVPAGGSLEPWARHGVMLLNVVLTVGRAKAWSHSNRGWDRLNAAILAAVNAKQEPVVFLLWGRRAQEAGVDLDDSRHIVIRSSHPSGFSARRPCRDSPPFIGSAPFSRANAELARRHRPPVNWDL